LPLPFFPFPWKKEKRTRKEEARRRRREQEEEERDAVFCTPSKHVLHLPFSRAGRPGYPATGKEKKKKREERERERERDQNVLRPFLSLSLCLFCFLIPRPPVIPLKGEGWG
jgi:hypothetical protein